MTNVPFPSFGDTGFTSPLELDVLSGALADMNAAFGGNMNLSVSTPQGQLGMSWAAVISAFNDLFVDFTNQVDPAYASGRMQDAIARIYFLTRQGATPTVVTGRCSGATGVIIAVGSLARATDGTIYSALTSGIISASGFVDIQFAAIVTGPIECPVGALSFIYRTVPGWDSVTNSTAGTPGRNEESRGALETRRQQTVAQNAIGILAAVRGQILGSDSSGNQNVPGIVDAYVTENPTAADVTVGTQTIVKNSLYVCVEGGVDADVAKAIFLKKSPGCNYSGSTSVTVADTNGGYITPPTYTVKFQRAATLSVDIVVTLANGTDVPSDVESQVQDVVTKKFNTLARIGQTLYSLVYVCPVEALGDWAKVLGVTINGGASQAIGINQFPAIGSITVDLV